MPILDSHVHAFPDRIAEVAMKTLSGDAEWGTVKGYHNGTVAGLLASMDRAGIQKAILCSVATRTAQVQKITDWSVEIASDRIIPIASVHPDYEQPEAEIERIAARGIKGIKFHPQYMNCALDDPRTIRIAKAAARARIGMVLHCGYDLAYARDELGGPAQLRRLHERVPDLRNMACHLGGWQRWEEVLAHVAGRPIWFETSFSLGPDQCPEALLRRILDAHSPEYLLFGTDSPWRDQSSELDKFRGLPISAHAITAALWDNAFRFLNSEAK
jgi:predicted TIM-barrel fold metal-dependent hydrolase